MWNVLSSGLYRFDIPTLPTISISAYLGSDVNGTVRNTLTKGGLKKRVITTNTILKIS